MFQSNKFLWWSVLCLASVSARAEWTDQSQKKVDEALQGLQTTISLFAQQFNARIPRKEAEYTRLEETIFARDYSQGKIEDLDRYLKLYESLGEAGEPQAKIIRGQLQKHQQSVKELDRSIKRQEKEIAKYNKTATTKEVDPHPEVIQRVNNWRNEIVRDVLQKLPSATNQMTPEETIAYLEGICTKFEANNKVMGLLDVKLAFGPGYGGSELVGHLRARVIDTLATWGTKEAWAAIGRIADSGGYASTRMVAAQHILRELTSAKALGLSSIEKPGPNLQLLLKLLADAPHKFNTETTYYDMETGALVKYDPANRDFKKANAKERFIPHDAPLFDRKTFLSATENVSPQNRWAQLPGKLKRAGAPKEEKEAIPPLVATVPQGEGTTGAGTEPPVAEGEKPLVVVETHTGDIPAPKPVEEKVEVRPEPPPVAIVVDPQPPKQGEEGSGVPRPVGEQPPPSEVKQPKPRGLERLMGFNPALDTLLVPFLWLQNRMSPTKDRNVASLVPPGGPNGREGAQGSNCGFGQLRYNHRGNR